MKINTLLLSFGLNLVISAFALAQSNEAPSNESLQEIIELAGSEKIFVETQDQMRTPFSMMMNGMVEKERLTEDKKAIMDKMQSKMADAMAEEFNWETMKSLYFQVYKETFTQSEINELIAFYKSSTGKMFIEKMPAIMQKTTALTQQQIQPLIERFKQIAEESKKEFQDAKKAEETSMPNES